MNNPFQIQFTLRQHTPIIHFQHDQDGATLRATEVKPKLDRFLIEKTGGLNPIDGKDPFDAGIVYAKIHKWLIGEGKNGIALDYQMRIIAQDNPTGVEINNFPCFFADIGDGRNYFKHHKENIILQINCFHTELKQLIEEKFSAFISETNFGMRQSKGFGCFAVLGQKIDNAVAYFTISKDNSNNCKELFKAIDIFYKSIRGGVRNYDGGPPAKFYFKSLLVAHYHQSSPTQMWDKEAIKAVLFQNNRTSTGTDIKDLLGLSTTEQWGNTATVQKSDEKTDALVDRFASPILFKPIYDDKMEKWTVYLFASDIPQSYKDTTIVAKMDRGKASLKMWGDFDLYKFLQLIEKYNDEEEFENHVQQYGGDDNYDNFIKHPDCHSLKKIFATYKIL